MHGGPAKVSFSTTTSWLISAGSMVRTACGSCTLLIVCRLASCR